MLAEKLVVAGETVSIIDTDEENCAEAKKIKEANVFCADATDVDVLRKVGVEMPKL